jgi:hypothetical protein
MKKEKQTMLKHVGRQGDKRVVVVFREVPGEEHMALVAYPQQLPTGFHDDIMKCIESNAGQAAKHLGDALHRVVGTDGANLLTKMHREGWMKKVRTQDIIMTPSPGGQGARLDEINQIIRDMEAGGDAASRLAEIDATSGLADPAKQQAGREAAAAAATPGGVLTDADLAQDLVKQADGMRAQINVLTEEIERLTAQAQDLDPSLAPKKRGRKKAAA